MTTDEGRPAQMNDCEGCKNDFYNGHNHIGVKECWSLKTAKVVPLFQIGYHTPMDKAENFRRVEKPRCWHAPGQLVVMSQLPNHLRGREDRVR